MDPNIPGLLFYEFHELTNPKPIRFCSISLGHLAIALAYMMFFETQLCKGCASIIRVQIP